MADHIFAGMTAIVAMLGFLNTVYIQRRAAHDLALIKKQHDSTMTAVAENTAITKELDVRVNGRLSQLLELTDTEAKARGKKEESDEQGVRDAKADNVSLRQGRVKNNELA